MELKDKAEIVIAVCASDIENKIRSDMGITYDVEVLRLIDAFVIAACMSAVLSLQYAQQCAADSFKAMLEHLWICTLYYSGYQTISH